MKVAINVFSVLIIIVLSLLNYYSPPKPRTYNFNNLDEMKQVIDLQIKKNNKLNKYNNRFISFFFNRIKQRNDKFIFNMTYRYNQLVIWNRINTTEKQLT